MIDHFNLPVSNLDASMAFYKTVLDPLNKVFLLKDGDAAGFGRNSWEFGIVQTDLPINKLHLAFHAKSNETVNEFYRAAIEVGGIDNGKPGFRSNYGEGYYAAYILDLDGHNIEAVCRNC